MTVFLLLWTAADVVLNEVMTKVPVNQATPAVKAYMTEIILKAAATGQTNYEVLLGVASGQIQIVLSQLN